MNSKDIFDSSVLLQNEIIKDQLVVMLLECDSIKLSFTLVVATSEFSSYIYIYIYIYISLSCKYVLQTSSKALELNNLI